MILLKTVDKNKDVSKERTKRRKETIAFIRVVSLTSVDCSSWCIY